MNILVLANEESWNELIAASNHIQWVRAENIQSFINTDNIHGYFNLLKDAHRMDYSSFTKPVFINSVCVTLKNSGAGEQVTRINGWNGFLKRPLWEIAGEVNVETIELLKLMEKEFIKVPDEPGFISARIVAMIINEAYFAREENVSSKEEINVAMKLGTNYPHGPFEWIDIIGKRNVIDLLSLLSETDKRYEPCCLLLNELSITR